MTRPDSHESKRIFRFEFEDRYRRPARLFGIEEGNAVVTLTVGRLVARFGRWAVSTPLANISEVSLTGPYMFLKTAGPAHLSLSDRGITFASNSRQGVCIAFAEPVGGIEPLGVIKHPNLTVTVADCAGLLAALGDSAK